MRAMVTDADRDVAECIKEINAFKFDEKPVSVVTSKKIWFARTKNPKYNILAIDCGIRHSTIKALNSRGANVIVVPYDTPLDVILKYKADGIVISNGPGSPYEADDIVKTIKGLVGKKPILGVCLGAELLAAAYGAKVSKMKCGHHGANHPVRKLSDDTIEIFVQNHSYAVDSDSLKAVGLSVTEINVLDKTVESFEDVEKSVYAVMYYPDVSAEGKTYMKFFDAIDKTMGGDKNAQENRY